jgi:threonine/homoserine/homoserine lactone efflux protein
MTPGYGGAVVTLVLAALGIMGSPGPSTISLVAAGAAYGFRETIGYCAGLVAGACLVLLAVAGGVTAVLLAVPALHAVLLIAAAAYVLWLAVRLAVAPAVGEQYAAGSRPTFAGGAVLGAINPKAWIAIAAVFASARVAPSTLADTAVKVPLLVLMIIVIHVGWLVAGRVLASRLRSKQVARAVNLSLAAVLVGATALALIP